MNLFSPLVFLLLFDPLGYVKNFHVYGHNIVVREPDTIHIVYRVYDEPPPPPPPPSESSLTVKFTSTTNGNYQSDDGRIQITIRSESDRKKRQDDSRLYPDAHLSTVNKLGLYINYKS